MASLGNLAGGGGAKIARPETYAIDVIKNVFFKCKQSVNTCIQPGFGFLQSLYSRAVE